MTEVLGGSGLTAGDVCELAGPHMNLTTLDRWAADGLLGPALRGAGSGRHRVFTEMQTLAVMVGTRWRSVGADHARVAGVVKYLAGVSRAFLDKEIAAGRTVPVGASHPALAGLRGVGGMMMEPPIIPELPLEQQVLMRMLEVGEPWRVLNRKLRELADQPAESRGRGRVRGSRKRAAKAKGSK